LKVVILNNDFRVYWKGRLIYLRQYLTAQKIDFHAIELFGKGSPYSFDEYNNSLNWWSCLFADNSASELSISNIQSSLFKKLDAINPDVIIAPSIVFFAGALGIRWAKKNRKKFIMFDDATPGQVKRNFIVQWVKNLIFEQVNGFWFPTKGYFNEFSYLSNKGVHFFYGFNSIDNSFFKLSGKPLLNHKTIICVARLVPVKNLDTLIKAWQVIESLNTGYRLAIVGNGPEYHALNTLKLDLNLKTVDFLGIIANENLLEFYSKADAFILPSLSESWGLVVNEAMAAGLPVLLSHNINASKYLLKEGVNGYGFDPLNVADIAQVIKKYIDTDITSKQLMSANSLEIIDDMSYEKMGIQLAKALQIITEQKYKRPSFLAAQIINTWNGRYNTTGWDKL